MEAELEYDTFTRPNRVLSSQALDELHTSLCALGTLCLTPLPDYQVFSSDPTVAFDDKIVVVARQNGKVMAFVSIIILETKQFGHPVIHSGLTCIHPDYRRSKGVLQQLFGNVFLHLLTEYAEGVWMTTVTDIVSSLVHMSKYCVNNFPSPAWKEDSPSDVHLQIARAFSTKHRSKALVLPTAELDERRFVFRGSNNHQGAEAFRKDIDDPSHWHRDSETSKFYRELLSPGSGDEVLLIGFLDPTHIKMITSGDRFRSQWMDRFAKL